MADVALIPAAVAAAIHGNGANDISTSMLRQHHDHSCNKLAAGSFTAHLHKSFGSAAAADRALELERLQRFNLCYRLSSVRAVWRRCVKINGRG